MKKLPFLVLALLPLGALASHLLAPGAPASGPGDGGPRPRLLSAPGEPPRVLTLEGGTLDLPGTPERVLPANAGIVELLSVLVPADHVVAIPEVARDYSLFDEEDPGAAAWHGIEGFTGYHAEVVFALDPDLVLASPWQSPEATAALRAHGVPVLLLDVPKTWDDALWNLEFLAKLFGVPDRGAALRADLEERRARLAASPYFGTGLTALSYTNFGTGGTTAGAGTTMDVALGLAGLENAAAEAGIEGYGSLPSEHLLAIDPDFLVVSAGDGQGDSASLRYLRETPALRSLRALAAGRILVLPSALAATTSIRLLDAAETLAGQVETLLEAEGALNAGESGARPGGS